VLGFVIDSKTVKPAPHKAAPQETSVIIVNERALAGPNSTAQVRGGRLFLPVASIAEALGDTLTSDAQSRVVTIRRQNGMTAVFNAPLNEVRENGAVILTVSGTADLVFPPTSNELMLPAEIVAALLDVVVRRDESRAIVLLAHQPKAVIDACRHAVDLQLSGHTHGGQIWPWGYAVRIDQPHVAGLHDHEGTAIYVSRGTGYWGPPMRVAAAPEITRIELVNT